ncbi:MAG: GNAT family N-acetyltransferase [Phycisphaerales bacterium]|nr:GNAT family N-acetyltransferase [Planctomycetota bacterium]MCH8508311.1 GNAT family N-acetyltransferase [Phycisphaerales bacterium]
MHRIIDPARLALLESRRQAVGVAEIADTAEPILGGTMCYTAPGSWTNQAMGLALDHAIAHEEIEQETDHFVDFYVARGQEPRIELCPFAHDAFIAALAARGFTLVEFETVMARPLNALDPTAPAVPAGVTIRRIDPHDPAESAEWIRVSNAGFLEPGDPKELVFTESSRRVITHPRSAAFVAEQDGRVIGAGAMEIADPFGDEPIACLFAAAVLPEHRRRGVQQTLIAARTEHARRAGATHAFIHAKPGIPTERNARRLGFETVYTNAVLVMRRDGLARSV